MTTNTITTYQDLSTKDRFPAEPATTAQIKEAVADRDLARNEFFTVFPSASESNWQDWNRLRENVQQLEQQIGNLWVNTETQTQIVEHLANARKFLRFEDEYTILMVGSSKAGKSTLINALQGRNLLVSAAGGSVTGTVIKVSPISRQEKEEQERALIYYHTWEKLEKLATNSGVSPIYTGSPKKLDISQTFTELENQKLNFEDSQKIPQAAISRLEDTIEIFQAFVRRHETPGELNIPKQTILLDEAGLQQLRDICDQNSELNKNKDTEVIPLIDHVEYRVYFSDGDQNRLAPTILMDVPGANSLKTRDYQRLREQVKSPKTRAFVLVTDKDGMTLGINRLLAQIRKALISGLSDKDAQLQAMSRLLIVVNKADKISPEIDTKEKIEEAIRSITELIHPEFYQKYGKSNVFREVKAKPGLIASLMQKHPQEGNEWLEEQEPADGMTEQFKRKYPIFGGSSPSYYRGAIDLALTSYNPEQRDKLIESWSQVPDLAQRLNEFLGENRLRDDYEQAGRYYREAIVEIDRALLSELEEIVPSDQRDEARRDPIGFIEKRVGNEAEEDRNQIREDEMRVTSAFKNACANVEENRNNFVDAIAYELTQVFREANNLIEQEITSPEFERKHFGISVDKLQEYQNNGNVPALKELRDRIENYLAQQSLRIAAKVWEKFQDSLRSCRVEDIFQMACYEQQYTTELQEKFKTKNLKKLENYYLGACNVTILERTMSYDPVVGIRQVWAHFGSSQPISANEATTNLRDSSVNEKIGYVRTHFTEVHKKLREELPKPLYLLFRRQMLKDESKMEELAQTLYQLHFECLAGSDEQKKEALIKALRAKRDKMTTRLLEWKTKWEQYTPFREG